MRRLKIVRQLNELAESKKNFLTGVLKEDEQFYKEIHILEAAIHYINSQAKPSLVKRISDYFKNRKAAKAQERAAREKELERERYKHQIIYTAGSILEGA